MKIQFQCAACGSFVGYSFTSIKDRDGRDTLIVEPDECDCGSPRIMQIAEGGRYHHLWNALRDNMMAVPIFGNKFIHRILTNLLGGIVRQMAEMEANSDV